MHAKDSSPHSTPLRGVRRVLAIALAAAAVFAAIVGAVSPAQDAAPTSTATSAPTTAPPEPPSSPEPPAAPAEPAPDPAPVEPAPTETAPVEPAPTETATATPDAAPVDDSTPTPFPSPVETTVQATPEATAEGTPAATATPAEKRKARRRANAEHGEADLAVCSTSTSTRDCHEESGHSGEHGHGDQRRLTPAPQLEHADGSPAPSNPAFSLAMPGPARIGVPNFFIDKFRIPPFLLSIYQAAGMEYGVRWEILAAINEIETDYGRNLNVSSAGALGWMQFMPATWKSYGVDANRDGERDPYNPVDAIFAAARYLRAAGAETDIRKAIFAYNHADWYVDSVLMRAQVIGGLPADLVGSLTGLTQGRFPVHAKATYAGALKKADRKREIRHGANAAVVVEADGERRGIEIFARRGAPVIAVNDGRVMNIGRNKRLGRFVQVRDVYGNTYTYARLGRVAKTYPAPKRRTVSREQVAKELELPRKDAAPNREASGTERPARKRRAAAAARRPQPKTAVAKAATTSAPLTGKQRLFAHPARPKARAAGGEAQLAPTKAVPSQSAPLGFDKRDFRTKRLVEGSRVIGGTILGRLGRSGPNKASHVLFEIRPAGRGAPRIDPKPILDGWKLLESTAVYRAAGKNPFFGEDAKTPTIGEILLMSKEMLVRRVLENPRIEIYGCGRGDIRAGQIDRRVLATLEFLASSGLKPTVSSLRCGHGYYTASGNVSAHSSGNALDIAAINGVTITPATQGAGSITDLTIQRLLTLQGTMKPDQIISLMTFDGAENTMAMADHADHIHVGWRPLYGHSAKRRRQIDAVLKPQQWIKLIDRLDEIDMPTVREQPSKFSVKVTKPASRAHHGE